MQYHNTVEKGFTSRYRPWEIVFVKEFDSKNEAMKAEKKIKNWKSKKMIQRIQSGEIKLWAFGCYPDKVGMQVLLAELKIKNPAKAGFFILNFP